jgi:hypothetical protein
MPPKKGTTTDVEPAEVARIADLGLAFDPDPRMARGDCRDAMLAVLRTTADWSKLSEQQQRDINAQIDQTAETIVAKLVKAIASEGRDAIRAKVEQLTVKDGLKLQLTAIHDHDNVVLLGDLVGKHVSLVAADEAAHDGQRGPAQLDRDQPELPVGDDSDLVNAADESEDTSGGDEVGASEAKEPVTA